MKSVVQPSYSAIQMTTWLRGLLSVAWADGQFDSHERQLIGELIQELAPGLDIDGFEPVDVDDLADGLGDEPKVRENFLRTAVMVALADGVYSTSEDEMLQKFCQGLGLDTSALQALRSTMVDESAYQPAVESASAGAASSLQPPSDRRNLDVLKPARALLDGLDVDDPRLARFLCKMIPSQCPFERDVKLFGHKVVHIPPMCKLNPLYEQLVGLRFRALCYLADDLGEDVSQYC